VAAVTVLFSLQKNLYKKGKEGGDVAGKKNEKINEAEKLYHAGEKLVDIAHKLDVPEGTVRRWKSTHKWDLDKSERSVSEKSERSLSKKQKKKSQNMPMAAEVEDVCKNSGLTDKQRLFCIYYVKCFNATKAYQKAYGCSYETAVTNGPRLLGNARIKTEILNLKQNRFNRELLHEDDIFQKYMDIAFADMSDYVEFGNKEIDILNEVTGEQEKMKVSYVNVRDSCGVDGTIVTEVSKGRDGIRIKLADRMQALKWLADHMDLATEEQKARIASLKARTGTDGDLTYDVLRQWTEQVLKTRRESNGEQQ
jgi:phage terminase small subunit